MYHYIFIYYRQRHGPAVAVRELQMHDLLMFQRAYHSLFVKRGVYFLRHSCGDWESSGRGKILDVFNIRIFRRLTRDSAKQCMSMVGLPYFTWDDYVFELLRQT